ncbi:MICOS complex subunit MIC60-like [Vanessa cardui]|uniref:MICOS complex subunit MIC60-like n=1 Tax=Vanessa cardui TaxID=171605 RepID=UPI001F13B4FC|nr:MICOS complex subunit MIC60-like [Vanessa cardui]
MSRNHYIAEELKLKLKSARKIKLRNERIEHTLRSEEFALTEEVSLIKIEIESISQQLEDVQKQISQIKYQNTMIDICSESEKSKVESHTISINNHKKAFDDLFKKECIIERDDLEFQQMELKAKQAKAEDLERQAYAKVLEENEQKEKEAAAIEEEYEALERECNILRKRNKAIMLMLRRKLIEAEETRRNLMKKN